MAHGAIVKTRALIKIGLTELLTGRYMETDSISPNRASGNREATVRGLGPSGTNADRAYIHRIAFSS